MLIGVGSLRYIDLRPDPRLRIVMIFPQFSDSLVFQKNLRLMPKGHNRAQIS